MLNLEFKKRFFPLKNTIFATILNQFEAFQETHRSTIKTFAEDAGPQNGNNLDLATQEFLEEIRSTRVLQMKPNSNGDYMLTTIDFVEYLGILLEIEPELTWIAREMCNAPMPPNVSY